MDTNKSKEGVVMKEIGGYFELDMFKGKGYYDDLIKLNTGRNALLYLIRAKKIRKLYLPYFICNSITDILINNSIEYEFYHIDKHFLPIFNKYIDTNQAILIVNYYGQLTDELIMKFKQQYKSIILDNTQAFFHKPLAKIDTFYSCRKYFGVSDGAYLATDTQIVEELAIDQSFKRMKHVLGRFEESATNYYLDFKNNDESFKTLPLKKMSKLTDNILKGIDYQKVKQQRNSNFAYLDARLNASNGISIIKPDGPFAYPYYLENGISIRKKLIQQHIYIPVLWPNVLNDNDNQLLEYRYAANILPLPCDQRNQQEDMEIIIKTLKEIID